MVRRGLAARKASGADPLLLGTVESGERVFSCAGAAGSSDAPKEAKESFWAGVSKLGSSDWGAARLGLAPGRLSSRSSPSRRAQSRPRRRQRNRVEARPGSSPQRRRRLRFDKGVRRSGGVSRLFGTRFVGKGVPESSRTRHPAPNPSSEDAASEVLPLGSGGSGAKVALRGRIRPGLTIIPRIPGIGGRTLRRAPHPTTAVFRPSGETDPRGASAAGSSAAKEAEEPASSAGSSSNETLVSVGEKETSPQVRTEPDRLAPTRQIDGRSGRLAGVEERFCAVSSRETSGDADTSSEGSAGGLGSGRRHIEEGVPAPALSQSRYRGQEQMRLRRTACRSSTRRFRLCRPKVVVLHIGRDRAVAGTGHRDGRADHFAARRKKGKAHRARFARGQILKIGARIETEGPVTVVRDTAGRRLGQDGKLLDAFSILLSSAADPWP